MMAITTRSSISVKPRRLIMIKTSFLARWSRTQDDEKTGFLWSEWNEHTAQPCPGRRAPNIPVARAAIDRGRCTDPTPCYILQSFFAVHAILRKSFSNLRQRPEGRV